MVGDEELWDMQAKLGAEARSACWSEGGAVRASLAQLTDSLKNCRHVLGHRLALEKPLQAQVSSKTNTVGKRAKRVSQIVFSDSKHLTAGVRVSDAFFPAAPEAQAAGSLGRRARHDPCWYLSSRPPCPVVDGTLSS